MKLIADEKIPGIQDLFSNDFSITLLPDHLIQHNAIKNYDVLITRSTVILDESLLKNTNVKMIASPTSGTDHMHFDPLNKLNISWCHAPGCNSLAVADYVIACIAALQCKKKLFLNKHPKAGVIGVGRIGRLVVDRLQKLGFHVIQHDPPRAEKEATFTSVPLSQFHDLDLICLHTPLTYQHPYPTHHMIDKHFLRQQKNSCAIINAGRGAVIHTDDFIHYGKHLVGCFDVFENEPTISEELLKQATIATPHIAGYSKQAKWRGTIQIYLEILKHFNLKPKKIEMHDTSKNLLFRQSNWQEEVLRFFNPLDLTSKMKSATDIPHTFLTLRDNYHFRDEFAYALNEEEIFA